jgi:cell division protein FtsB
MRGLFILLTFLLLLLQYPLWFSDNSVPDAWKLRAEIEALSSENLRLAERNRLLDAEVLNLKKGLDVVEEKARYELGMIKKGETFYQVIEQDPNIDTTSNE